MTTVEGWCPGPPGYHLFRPGLGQEHEGDRHIPAPRGSDSGWSPLQTDQDPDRSSPRRTAGGSDRVFEREQGGTTRGTRKRP